MPKQREFFAGDIQTISTFLLLPKRIGNETRWLKRATYKREFIAESGYGGFWKDLKWVD